MLHSQYEVDLYLRFITCNLNRQTVVLVTANKVGIFIWKGIQTYVNYAVITKYFEFFHTKYMEIYVADQ